MSIIATLIPVTLFLGGLGLLAFVWALMRKQYEDPKGAAERIISGEWDDYPKP